MPVLLEMFSGGAHFYEWWNLVNASGVSSSTIAELMFIGTSCNAVFVGLKERHERKWRRCYVIVILNYGA